MSAYLALAPRGVMTVRLLVALSLAILAPGAAARADSFLSADIMVGSMDSGLGMQVVPIIRVDASQEGPGWYFYDASYSEVDWSASQSASFTFWPNKLFSMIPLQRETGPVDVDFGVFLGDPFGVAPGRYVIEVTATVAQYANEMDHDNPSALRTESTRVEFTVSAPEPSGVVMGGIAALGGIALAATRRRRRAR